MLKQTSSKRFKKSKHSISKFEAADSKNSLIDIQELQKEHFKPVKANHLLVDLSSNQKEENSLNDKLRSVEHFEGNGLV
jgi:hypothetical protein